VVEPSLVLACSSGGRVFSGNLNAPGSGGGGGCSG